MKICVVGAGYVGLANALVLCKNNNVVILDVDANKIKQINRKQSPIKDKMIEEYLTNDNKIYATLDKKNAYENCDYIIIATPTNYDENTQYFDTKSIESVMFDIVKFNKDAIVIIKSTIPIGYTKYLKMTFAVKDIIFCPEFLREGNALYDNLYPSRIIIGSKGENAHNVAKIFSSSVLKENTPVLFMDSSEAESVKLFSNTYLAMRVGFFNELDTFAKSNKLNTEDIISGVCADPRIGNYYNNPSFGYGGYCLPKDSKQLLYEPLIDSKQFNGCEIENDFEKFINRIEMIVANRLDKQLTTYRDKVYTSDIYTSDI
ncbi:nucleotide sugar dehydrogenase [Campylobacter coli]|nr:nucleotide sugar dehydrogenase [Campylobacter coli]EAK7139778.1 nucleotide sugar dehydrogenase [Campylobacter coli]EJE0426468.1 nucleotide sugar dehydrogenase [Campylobacter coli]ELW5211261.1 nucleotide sugar dehydrogenase [Campylobacter coli]